MITSSDGRSRAATTADENAVIPSGNWHAPSLLPYLGS
jgi:hypothetical protein